MPLKIIGAGLGRTGTRSLKTALETLGFPTFHMTDLFARTDRLPHFEDALAGRPVDWEALFDGYTATVDYPAALFWRQQRTAYPDARVILSARPAEAWYTSARRTIYESGRRRIARGEPANELQDFVQRCIWRGQFGGRFEEPEHARAVYERHNAAVRSEVPADRLLEYAPGAGWAPLCAFLGVPEPDVPYPHVNTSAEFTSRMNA